MVDSPWVLWTNYAVGATATAEFLENGVFRVTKPTADGTTRIRLYPRVKAGDTIRFVIEARLLEGVIDETTPAIGIDYPGIGDLVESATISSSQWRSYELNFTVPFDAGDSAIAPITIGAWTDKVGTVEFKNYRLYVNGTLAPALNPPVTRYINTLGNGWSEIPITPFNTGETLLLGLWDDTEFRIMGKIYGMRNVQWSTTENHQTLEISSTGNGTSRRNTQWRYDRVGSEDSLIVAKVVYQGVAYLGLVGNDNYIFAGDKPVFMGFQRGLINRAVATADLDAFTPAQDFMDHEIQCDYSRNGYPDYYGRNVLDAVGFDSNGYPSGGLIESGENANGWYIKFADGTLLQQVDFSAGEVSFSRANAYQGITIYQTAFDVTLPAEAIDAKSAACLSMDTNVNSEVGTVTYSFSSVGFRAVISTLTPADEVVVGTRRAIVLGRWKA